MKKNLKITIVLITSLFILSCSKNNDDDVLPIVTYDYFPKKITTTTPSSTTPFGTTTIQYDSKNRISKLICENSDQSYIFEMTYNANNTIQSIVSNKITSTTNNMLTFNCTYTNSILSQIVLSNGSSSIPFNFIYDNATNKYTIEGSSSSPDYFKYDASGNLTEYYFSGLLLYLTHNNNKGIYNGTTSNSLPLIFVCSVNGFDITLYYTYFFANKEITSINLSLSNEFDYTVTRDSHNNIGMITMKNSSTDETVLSSTIDYELRIKN